MFELLAISSVAVIAVSIAYNIRLTRSTARAERSFQNWIDAGLIDPSLPRSDQPWQKLLYG